MPRVPTAPRAPRANQNVPNIQMGAASRRAPASTTKPVQSVTTGKPQQGDSRVRPNGMRQVYRNGRWVNVGRVRPTKPSSPGGAPVAARLTPTPAPAAAPAAPAAVPSGWWADQFMADPRYQSQFPALAARENEIARSYGFIVRRAANGQAYYRLPETGAGGGNITSSIDDAGNLVYRDEAGNAVAPERIKDLVLDVVEVSPTESAYRQGALGRARMESAGRQFGIGDVAAQAGARRSGMRAGASGAEAQALVNALGGLTTRAGGEFAGVGRDYLNLYNQIYADLAEKAKDLVPPAPEAPPAETPAPAPSGTAETGMNIGQALTPAQFGAELAGIAGISRNAPRNRVIKFYRDLAKNFALTPAQRRRVERILKSNFGVSL